MNKCICSFYRKVMAPLHCAAPCKDRVTAITFGSDVPFVKQVHNDNTSLRGKKLDKIQRLNSRSNLWNSRQHCHEIASGGRLKCNIRLFASQWHISHSVTLNLFDFFFQNLWFCEKCPVSRRGAMSLRFRNKFGMTTRHCNDKKRLCEARNIASHKGWIHEAIFGIVGNLSWDCFRWRIEV